MSWRYREQAQPSLRDCSGRCHARWCSHALRFQQMAGNLTRLASWRRPTPTSYDARLWEHTHIGGGFSWCYSLSEALHFLKPFGLVTGTFVAQNSLYIWNNTVVFLPVALRYGTRTLFSFQGALLSTTKHIQICNIEIPNKVGSYEEKSNESLFTGLMAKATDKPIYPHGLKPSGLRRVPVCVSILQMSISQEGTLQVS